MRCVLLFSILLVGCSTEQPNLTKQKYDQIQVNETTKSEVIELVGDDYNTVIADMFDMDIVQWEEGSGHNLSAFTITFDQNETVVDKSGINLR